MTKAKPKIEKIKAVKEIKPKKTEKAKIETKSKTKTQTKKEVKTKSKPKATTSKGKKKVVEEKIYFSVMSHALVPKHEIVSDSEIPGIMKKYNIESKSQFPKILSEDPAVKEIDAKIGNVIRIYRKEPTGDCLYYRVVISSKKV